ncbi:MAG: hypothetical protein ACXW3E_04485 [Thermoanaerobaculia bacterium]
MRIPLLAIALALSPAILHADALADLRAALARLPATAPVNGTLDVTSVSTNNEEEKADTGKATVGFDAGDAGLRILYPRATIVQANQEARGEAIDPEHSTPVRSGLRRVRPIHVAELLDAAASLNVVLQNAQLVQTKGRVIVLKLAPKLSKAANKHMKKLESTLTLKLGEDGVPIAAERTTSIKASMLLISFENAQKESWTYTRSGHRLVATRYEHTEKTDGFGRHPSS